jgi:16S rRNA (guanine527-N7)-methyltransferase
VSDLENDLREMLVLGSEKMSVPLGDTQISNLLSYIREFEKWNKAYNLSAVRDIRQMVARHLLDSLSIVPYVRNTQRKIETMIDVGTGGGLPGIPLAIMFPEKHITLLDSNGKKTRFLFHIKTLLKLNNVAIENCRVEELQPTKKFDAVISRAFASLQDMTGGCTHMLASDGIFLAMKGMFPTEELVPIAEKIKLVETIKLNVAETDGERHLLILQTKK